MRRTFIAVVIAAALALVGCKPLLVPPGDAPLRYRDEVFASVTKTADITYGTAVRRDTNAEVSLLADVYAPSGDTAVARPLIIWVHGGSFKGGSKTSGEIVDQANVFAKKGYVSMSINYRLSPQGCAASGPTTECVLAIIDAKHDAQAAVRYAKANAAALGIDPNRIAINGSSAGAITALNVGYDATEVGTGGSNPGQSSDVEAAVSLSGARLMGTLDADDAPSLLFHGTADVVVPYAWAEATTTDAKAAGLESYLTAWDGATHVPYAAHRTEIIDQTTNFLYWTLALDQL
ncbi:MAG: alpha/beta hydrolase [Acidimicrobiales bacterium]|nr:alpha/beta hydrolase [Acidimicrobiales bacterium]MCB1262704.1 alpha/beta hydrolase [Acidimicrobiales bacterium]